DVLERRAGPERRHVGLLDLDGLPGARVPSGASGPGSLLEDAESGDGHLAARFHLPLNHVDERLHGGLGGSPVAVELLGDLVDHIGLVHDSSKFSVRPTRTGCTHTVNAFGRDSNPPRGGPLCLLTGFAPQNVPWRRTAGGGATRSAPAKYTETCY